MRLSKPPLSREQLKQGDLIEKGTYDFRVEDASEEVSKKGQDMIKLKLRIYMPDGRERLLTDYLTEALEFKFGNFCLATGLYEKYEAREITNWDCIGKSGQCKIGIKIDKEGVYADQNNVVDYVLSDEAQAAKLEKKVAAAKQAAAASDPGLTDDAIPF
jgi:hypothetical protein